MANYRPRQVQTPSTPEPETPQADDHDSGAEPTPAARDSYEGDPRLSPLEAQVLGEWARLRRNLDTLAEQSAGLAANPSSLIGDDLRLLERKTTLVCTALKSSVYSIVLSAQDEEGVGSGM